jgi:hypothetical protein
MAASVVVSVAFALAALGAYQVHKRGERILFRGVFVMYSVHPLAFAVMFAVLSVASLVV